MDKRVVGTLLGIAGMLLWFMPWTEFSMGDLAFYPYHSTQLLLHNLALAQCFE